MTKRGVRKRGSLVDDDAVSPPKLSIENDGSDYVVESSDMPQELQDSATNVTTDAAVTYLPPTQQHLTYSAGAEGLFYHIQSQADTILYPNTTGSMT